MATIFTATQEGVASFTPRDAKKNIAKIDGVPEWASSDPNVMAVEPAEDGMSARVVAGQTGTAQITATMDVLVGAGVEKKTCVGDVEVVAGKASIITMEFGAPSEQAA